MATHTHPVLQAGKTALITGAASGVGLAIAKLCGIKHGMSLALVDKNEAALAELQLKEFDENVETQIYAVDVSSIDQWKDLRIKVEMDFGRVSLVVLNAGIAQNSGWDDTQYFHNIMDTNFFGVVHGINTFLPSLRAQQSPTAIVITGSKQGITNPPGNPAYNASKAAVKSVAEHLSYDLRSTPTSVFLLVPGWTFTGLMREMGVKDKPDGAWWPEQVAEYLEQKMAEDQFYVICPDNDVSEEKDKKRMLWTMGDVVEGRPPLSRWREKLKDEAEEWMAKRTV